MVGDCIGIIVVLYIFSTISSSLVEGNGKVDDDTDWILVSVAMSRVWDLGVLDPRWRNN